MLDNKKIVLCNGLRTPIGHISKSLSNILPEKLLNIVIKAILKDSKIDPEKIDGVIIGWVGQGSHAPNIARISALESGVGEKSIAVTLQCNCISGIESVSSAVRHIVMGEGELYIAGGVESMSSFPYAIRGDRTLKELRNLDSLIANWDKLKEEEQIKIVDCIEEGLTDPVKTINMAQTAEICAQNYKISRDEQDEYAIETFKRTIDAEERGFYKSHVVPVEIDGKTLLETDEYVMLRKSLAEKPIMFKKAPLLFQNSIYDFSQFYIDFKKYLNHKYDKAQSLPTVTLFNSCARSDAAAALIVTTEENALKLGLNILAYVKSWGYTGYDPAFMGVAPAFALPVALKMANLNFNDLGNIELHEAFAATVLSVFSEGQKTFGYKWLEKWKEKRLNPNGGSIPLGHPLAATGTRLLLNLIYAMKENNSKYGAAAACAAGGLGGAMILEKY